jgi:hypothetical protein
MGWLPLIARLVTAVPGLPGMVNLAGRTPGLSDVAKRTGGIDFGFERGHYEVSAACAERGLWPAARTADPQTAILADGFSCRTQLAAGRTGREALHLAQLLAQVTDR